jgi:rhodanese-related sulfurtransferase
MSPIRLVLAIAIGVTLPARLAAQDVAGRLDGRVPSAVRQAVTEIATNAAAQGLPVEPLLLKAIEGSAKGVPSDRVIAAVRALAGRLADAMGALHQAGVTTPSGDVVEGGADALNAGLSNNDVRDLALASRPPYDPAVTLRIAATLSALGVPAPETVQLVKRIISAGRPPSDLLGLPADVEAGVARGETPAQVAAGLPRGGASSAPGRPTGWVPPGEAKPSKPQNPHKP